MPNVAPNGVHVRTDTAGASAAASNVYTYDGSSWREADYVWTWDDTIGWHVIWSRTASIPANAAAALQGDGTVDITWDAPFPEVVTSYRVRRGDNSVVAENITPTGGSYLVTDSSPLIGTNAYTVEANLTNGNPNIQIEVTNTVGIDLSVDSVTAAAVGSVIQVSWTGEKPGTTEYDIYRPSGSLVGTVAYGGAGQIDDASPGGDIDNGQWEVIARDAGGNNGGDVLSNALDVARKPTSVTNTITSDSGEQATVTWSAPASNVTGWEINKAVNGDWSTVTTVGAGTFSYNYNGPSSEQGKSIQFQVRARFGNSGSAYVNSNIDYFNPNVPSAVSLVATSTLGQLTLTWGAPSSGVATAYEVQYSDNGSSWTGSSDDTSPSSRTFSGGSGTRYMRVRSIGAGGNVSSYVEKNTTPLWDNSPPAAPTITSIKPETSYGQLTIRWTTSSSDNYQMKPLFKIGSTVYGEGFAWSSAANSTSYSYTWNSDAFVAGARVYMIVQVRDQYLNTSDFAYTQYYELKPQVQSIFASGASHYRQGIWNYLGNLRPYQGYFSNPSYNYTGAIFYGENTIRDACNAISNVQGGDITVTSMKVTLIRPNEIGNSVTPVYMGTTTQYGQVGVPTVSNVSYMGTITRGTSQQYTLTSAQRTALITQSGGARGLGFYRYNSDGYFALNSVSENAFQGILEITSLG